MTFADSTGRAWTLPPITTRMLNRLRDDFKFDLREALKPDMGSLAEALNDDERVAALCWHLCAEEAGARGIDRSGWLDLFDGPTYQNAAAALLEAVWTFSRGPKKAAQGAAALRAAMGWATDSTSSNSAGGPAASPASAPPT